MAKKDIKGLQTETIASIVPDLPPYEDYYATFYVEKDFDEITGEGKICSELVSISGQNNSPVVLDSGIAVFSLDSEIGKKLAEYIDLDSLIISFGNFLYFP